MALFKISKGLSENLPTTYNEGYAYFTTDDGKFYIDTNNSVDGRIGLNAFKADTDRLGNIIDETYISFEEDEIIEGPVPKIDAETLNGKTADDFILKNDDIAYNKIILPDGSKWDGIITGSGSGGNVNPEEVLKIIKENSAYFDADSDGDVDIILPGGNSNSGSMDMSGYVKQEELDVIIAELNTKIDDCAHVDLVNGDEITNNSNSRSANIDYEQIVNIIYPIGRIIMTMANEDPNVLYPWQVWERTANGRFLLGADDSYAVGSMGGEASITLEEKHVPPHNHTISRGADKATGTTWESYAPGSGQTATGTHLINSTSRSAASAFSIMPPYLAVNMWKRTA